MSIVTAFVVCGRTARRRFTLCMPSLQDLDEYAECDVVITGAGSAGLCCAYELSKHPDIKVAIIEQGEHLRTHMGHTKPDLLSLRCQLHPDVSRCSN